MSSDGGVRVASAVPGRIRLRAIDPAGHRRIASLADEVGAWDEVASVDLRPRSGSVVIRFGADQDSAVSERLLSIGVQPPAGVPDGPPAEPATVIAAAAASANRTIGRRLDGTDLRVIVPLGLGLLAARRALRGEERLADAPWYVLAWYASETFWKFHGGAPAAGRPSNDGGHASRATTST